MKNVSDPQMLGHDMRPTQFRRYPYHLYTYFIRLKLCGLFRVIIGGSTR